MVPSRAIFFALLLLPSLGSAAELVYRPVNPAFGGNPFGADFLIGTATAQDEHVRTRRTTPRRTETAQEQFVRTLQSRLLSALANQVTEGIFGEDAQDEGQFVFGDQQISFVRGLETIDIEIFNSATGERTEISVPTNSVE